MNLRALIADALARLDLKLWPPVATGDYEGDEERHVDDPQEEGEAT